MRRAGPRAGFFSPKPSRTEGAEGLAGLAAAGREGRPAGCAIFGNYALDLASEYDRLESLEKANDQPVRTPFPRRRRRYRACRNLALAEWPRRLPALRFPFGSSHGWQDTSRNVSLERVPRQV